MTKVDLNNAVHDAAHDVCNVAPRANWTAPTCEVINAYDAEANNGSGSDSYAES